MSIDVNPQVLQSLRVIGCNKSPRLSDVERIAIDRSFRIARGSLSRAAFGYYATHSNDPHDGTAWLVSETYTYVITSVIAGKLAIPGSVRQWLAVAKTIRHRYYASREVVVDGGKAKFLGDNDTSVLTRINADRLQLDDSAFIAVLLSYACIGLGRDPQATADEGGAPQWMIDTVNHWVTAPDVSWADRAAELGVSRETIKSREAKCKAAVRAGIVGDLITIAD